MKLLITKDTYKASNVELKVSTDLKRAEAWSYGHWQFLLTDSVGNIVLNSSTWSNSTSVHQRSVAYMLKILGIPIHLELTNRCTKGTLKEHIEGEIKELNNQIKNLEEQIYSKRSKNETNVQRMRSIDCKLYRIADLQNYLENYIDKKLIPIKKETYASYLKKLKEYSWRAKEKYKLIQAYKRRYFTNKQGKVNLQALNEFIPYLYEYSSASYSNLPKIEKIQAALDLKEHYKLLHYTYINDLNNMLPNVDTEEYTEFKAFLKKYNINKHTVNNLMLEKMHTYFTNLINKKNYSPREPELFPVHHKLLKIEHPYLKVIKTDRDLRAEGRQQKHCIGGADYLKKCRVGYNVLNFKGYTFFTDQNLNILQCNGKHNSYVPENVREELETLLAA